MNREELYEWLSTCPTKQMYSNGEEEGIVTVTFHCDRDKKEVHKDAKNDRS